MVAQQNSPSGPLTSQREYYTATHIHARGTGGRAPPQWPQRTVTTVDNIA